MLPRCSFSRDGCRLPEETDDRQIHNEVCEKVTGKAQKVRGYAIMGQGEKPEDLGDLQGVPDRRKSEICGLECGCDQKQMH